MAVDIKRVLNDLYNTDISNNDSKTKASKIIPALMFDNNELSKLFTEKLIDKVKIIVKEISGGEVLTENKRQNLLNHIEDML